MEYAYSVSSYTQSKLLKEIEVKSSQIPEYWLEKNSFLKDVKALFTPSNQLYL